MNEINESDKRKRGHTTRNVAGIIFNAAWWAVAAIFVLFLIVTVVIPRVQGWAPLTVLTGSMQPTIHPGDLIFVEEAEAKDAKVGDIVSFMPNQNDASLIYTHRVVSITYGKDGVETLTTRGDNNPQDDPQLPVESIRGIVKNVELFGYKAPYVVPRAGTVFLAVTNFKNDLNFGNSAIYIGYGLFGVGMLYTVLSFRKKKAQPKRRVVESYGTEKEKVLID